MALKKLPIEKVIQCAEARNPALLNLGLLRRLPKRRIKSLQIALTIVLELSEKQSFDSKVHILSKWHQAKSWGREAQVDPQFSFQMPWVHKAGQAVYGGEYSSSLYYSVLGVKKQTKKTDEEKQVVTNVTPVPPGPSHLEHLPVSESLLNQIGSPRKKPHCL